MQAIDDRRRNLGTQATQDTPPTPVLRVMDTYSGQPAYPSAGYGSPNNSGYPAYSRPPASAPPSGSGQPPYPGGPGYGYQSPPPYSGSGYGNPMAGYPGDPLSEDWSTGAEHVISLLAEFRA